MFFVPSNSSTFPNLIIDLLGITGKLTVQFITRYIGYSFFFSFVEGLVADQAIGSGIGPADNSCRQKSRQHYSNDNQIHFYPLYVHCTPIPSSFGNTLTLRYFYPDYNSNPPPRGSAFQG